MAIKCHYCGIDRTDNRGIEKDEMLYVKSRCWSHLRRQNQYSKKMKWAINNKLMGENCRPGKEKGRKNCTYKLGRAFLHQWLIKRCNVETSKLGKAGGTTSLKQYRANFLLQIDLKKLPKPAQAASQLLTVKFLQLQGTFVLY